VGGINKIPNKYTISYALKGISVRIVRLKMISLDKKIVKSFEFLILHV
jgi:hypothetical protein